MKKKIGTSMKLLAIALVLLMTACGNKQAATATAEAAATENSVINTSIPTNAVTGGELQLDPANAGENPAVAYLYETLVKETDGEITGVLAESFSVSEDGLDYIFYLRPGVTFHNGDPLNADAVISNFNRWFDQADATRGSGEFQVWAESFGGFKGEVDENNKPKSTYDGIEKVDDLTVLVHLNTADTEFLKKMSNPAFSIVGTASLTANSGDGGTGAYKFGGIVDADTLKLDPFETYWDTASIPGESMEVSTK